MPTPFRILLISSGNAARGQMAEALFQTRGEKRPRGVVIAESVGTRPAPNVSEYALQTLIGQGIQWPRRKPRHIDELDTHEFELVITLCDRALAVCPSFAGAKAQVHWGLPDPTEHIAPPTARAAFAASCTALVARVNALLRLPLEEFDAERLREEAQGVHSRLVAPSRRTSARLWK